jgi:hypothetical protein
MVDFATVNAEISAWIEELIGRKVNIPEDLQLGVAFIEVLNKLKPDTIKKYNLNPTTLFQKAENFKKV